MDIKLEICVDSLESALIAEEAGSDRLELCAELNVGGLTPSIGLLKKVLNHVKIPVNVIIRPRGGDFIYSDFEFETMLEDVEFMKTNFPNINGFVVGILDEMNNINKEKMTRIIDIARPIPVTIHRAFDMTKDLSESLKTCIDLGVERILTAGFADKAVDGLKNIENLIKSSDDRIIIMPGSGICLENLPLILKELNPKEIHMSAKKRVESYTDDKNNGIHMGRGNNSSENIRYIANGDEIRKIKVLLSEFA